MLQTSAVRKDIQLLIATVAMAVVCPAGAAELNALKDLKVVPTGSGAQVVVSGSKAPTFTVFRLSDPDRLVIDLSSADASGIKGHHDGSGPVAGIVASQFTDERASVGRVLVALDHASQYDVHADGNRIVISVSGTGSAVDDRSASPTAVVSPSTSPKPEAAVASVKHSQPVTVALAEPVKIAAAPPAPVETPADKSASKGAENVVATQVDEREVKNPAKRITGLKFVKETLHVVADGEIAKYELIELSDPARLALDVYGVGLSARAPKVHSADLKEIRAGAHSEKVRVVLDMAGEMPRYHLVRKPHGLEIQLGASAAAGQTDVARKVSGPAASSQDTVAEAEIEIDGKKVSLTETTPTPVKPAPAAPPAVAQVSTVEVKDVSFADSPSGGQIEIKLSGPSTWKVERPEARGAFLTIEHAHIPKRLERSFDTSALDTPVKMISAFSTPGDRVRVAVSANGTLDEKVTASQSGLSWKLSVKGVKTEEVAVSPKTAGFTAEAETYASEGAPRKGYSGKRVSFEFKDIDIHNLLRVIAEVSRKNIVVADDVSGKVTIRLRNVPWDQALEIILRSKGLGKEDLGNIIRVAPLKTLEEESKLRESRKKSEKAQEELVVQLVPINYATAGQITDRVKDVLSERGSVSVDARTNVLIIRDIASNIAKARSLVQNLDTPTPQVLIESRIVEANTTYTRQLGVQWGGVAQAAQGTGNPTGLSFPNTVSVRGGSTSDSNQGTNNDPNFAVNLPVGVGTGSGGALGFIFGSAGGALTLNLRISALENQGSIKTISSPKVTTLDHNTAKISQGVSIPFSQVSAAGVSTSFVEARLSLEVTPHITQDGSILMAIKAENNQPDPGNTGANGQPAIQRKEASTQVMVKDGDTTVIGGIYIRTSSNSTDSVPFLSKIPILGLLFRDYRESDARQELLIFITPRIITRQTIAQNP